MGEIKKSVPGADGSRTRKPKRTVNASKNEIVMMDPRELTPYENNPRLNADAVDYVANSIRDFGFRNPIIVDKDLVIIAGHTRQKASLKLGLKEVPVIIASDMTEEQARAFRLADNKTAEISGWDFDALDIELDAVGGVFQMSDFGFQLDDLDDGSDDEEEVITDDGQTEFKEYGEDTPTKHKCPSCGYEWN